MHGYYEYTRIDFFLKTVARWNEAIETAFEDGCIDICYPFTQKVLNGFIWNYRYISHKSE